VCFNYNFCFHETFPDPKLESDHRAAYLFLVRRECRGIIFDERTGHVISRRFHKFFNINELDETQEHKIDFSQPHVILEKMDGCLVAPIIVDGCVRFGTKAGVTDISTTLDSHYVPSSGIDYVKFSHEWLSKHYTPMFEWCSLSQQIVVPYPNDLLILTAMRHNFTGEYLKFHEMIEAAKAHSIPVVKPLVHNGGQDVTQTIQAIRKLENIEGYVLRFENGDMYKIKCDWYVERSKRQAEMCGDTGYWREKNVWMLVLENKLDDILSGSSIGERGKRAEEFAKNLWITLEQTAQDMTNELENYKQQGLSKKDFAHIIQKRDIPLPRKTIYYRAHDSGNISTNNILDEIVKTIKKNCSTQGKLDSMREAFAPGVSFVW